jgi:hypothetical protein
VQISRHSRELALDSFFSNNALDLIYRGCPRIPGRLRMIFTKIAYKLLELFVSDTGEVRSCMTRVD